jgi:hypothetical protein
VELKFTSPQLEVLCSSSYRPRLEESSKPLKGEGIFQLTNTGNTSVGGRVNGRPDQERRKAPQCRDISSGMYPDAYVVVR